MRISEMFNAFGAGLMAAKAVNLIIKVTGIIPDSSDKNSLKRIANEDAQIRTIANEHELALIHLFIKYAQDASPENLAERRRWDSSHVATDVKVIKKILSYFDACMAKRLITNTYYLEEYEVIKKILAKAEAEPDMVTLQKAQFEKKVSSVTGGTESVNPSPFDQSTLEDLQPPSEAQTPRRASHLTESVPTSKETLQTEEKSVRAALGISRLAQVEKAAKLALSNSKSNSQKSNSQKIICPSCKEAFNKGIISSGDIEIIVSVRESPSSVCL